MHHPPLDAVSLRFPGAEPSAAAVFSAFMRTGHAHRQLMARKMATDGLHPSQMFCLSAIAHHEGTTQRDLAEELNIARPTLTVMLQKMERAGLVERTSDATDQRFTRIRLTPQGATLHDDMHRMMGEIIGELAGPLSETDRAELTRLLGLVHDNITAALNVPPEEGAR